MIARDYVRHSRGFVSQYSNFNFDLLYPVGSIYTTIDVNFNPNTAEGWNGTWQRLNDGYYLKTIDQNDPEEHCGSYYSTTKTITSSSHQLTINEMPVHKHDTGTMSMDATGAHVHLASSTTVQNDSNSAHEHVIKCCDGPWVSDNTPSVAYRHPLYEFKSGATANYSNPVWRRSDLLDAGYDQNSATQYSGGHTHIITTTIASNGDHVHELAGYTGEEGYGQGHDHTITLTNIKPNYIAVIIWKRVS